MSTLTVVELKERLRALNLSTAGAKAELVGRLLGAGVAEGELNPVREMSNGRGREEEDETGAAESGRAGVSLARSELDLCRREKELAEREAELLRREIALLRATPTHQTEAGSGRPRPEEL